MLTHEDIKNLTDYQKEIFVTKDDVGKLSLEIVNIKEIMATKDDLKRLEEKFERLIDSIDKYAKKVDSYYQEMIALNVKVNRHEKWFHLIADKLNIKLEY